MDLEHHKQCSPEACASSTGKKCKLVGAITALPSFQIDDYKIFSVNNVSAIGITPRDCHGWDVEYSENSNQGEHMTFLYIDSAQAEAFAHWVFESAFYLPVFQKLKEKHPQIKLLSFLNKNYMKAMYAALNITEDDVVHEIGSSNNTVFFPECSSLAIHEHCDLYMRHLKKFYQELTGGLPTPTKTLDILYLPRGTLENFKANDRTIPCQSQLVESLPQRFSNSLVYFTDSTKNMRDQIAIVRSASIIVLDYGSNLMFNGFFAENAKVLVIGNNHRHMENPRPFRAQKDSEERGVKYYYLPPHVSSFEVLNAIQILLAQSIPPFHHTLNCWRMCSVCRASLEADLH